MAWSMSRMRSLCWLVRIILRQVVVSTGRITSLEDDERLELRAVGGNTMAAIRLDRELRQVAAYSEY